MEQYNEYLNQASSAINQNPGCSALEWLKYLKNNHSPYSQYLKVFLFPKISTIDDIILLQSFLNNRIKSKNFSNLALYLKSIQTSKIIHNNTEFIPKVQIKLKKTKLLNYCFSKPCLSQGLRHAPEFLINLESCRFHTYCKPCLRNYLISQIAKDLEAEIICEACVNAGKTKNKVSKDEILFLLEKPKEAVLNDFNLTRGFNLCAAGRDKCKNRDLALEKDKMIRLGCGEMYCSDCYYEYVGNYILEISRLVQSDKKKLKELPFIGISCLKQHLKAFISLDERQISQWLVSSCFNKTIQIGILESFKTYKPLFDRKPFIFCSKCENIKILPFNGNIFCDDCSTCFVCKENYHLNFTCEEIKSYRVDKGQVKLMSASENKEFYERIKAILLLYKIENYKNFNFYSIDAPGMIRIKHEKLLSSLKSSKRMYVIGKPFFNADEIEEKALADIAPDDEDGFFRFSRKLDSYDKEIYLVIYRIIFEDKIVARCPISADKSRDQILFSTTDQIIAIKKDAILPYALVSFSQY